nr:Chain C, DECAMERIC PEPTIDE (EVAPPEYHRK) [synthetic construct]
EVAPPEYHRK